MSIKTTEEITVTFETESWRAVIRPDLPVRISRVRNNDGFIDGFNLSPLFDAQEIRDLLDEIDRYFGIKR